MHGSLGSTEHQFYVSVLNYCLAESKVTCISVDFPKICGYLAQRLLGNPPITASIFLVGKLRLLMATIISYLLCVLVKTQLQLGRYICWTLAMSHLSGHIFMFFIWKSTTSENTICFFVCIPQNHIHCVARQPQKRDFYP